MATARYKASMKKSSEMHAGKFVTTMKDDEMAYMMQVVHMTAHLSRISVTHQACLLSHVSHIWCELEKY